jgi:CheY-like chemotaxis protein
VLKVMIAEDDLLMADVLEEVLVQNGYEVCGIARTVEKAVELGERHKPDLAILDLRLAEGGIGTDIALRLGRRGSLGVLYATANAGHMRLTKADGEACLGKPSRALDVVRALEIVEQIVTTGEASRPFPKPAEPEPKGRRRPSAVRATLDDPPIHIRPTVPAISGCKAKEPFRFRPLRHIQGGTAATRSQRIFCRKRQETGDKRLILLPYVSGTSNSGCSQVCVRPFPHFEITRPPLSRPACVGFAGKPE